MTLDKFDRETFTEAKSIFKDRFSLVVEDFFLDSEELIKQVMAACESGDKKAVAAGAHPLKSSSKAFGLTALASLAQEIELQARKAAEDEAALSDDVKQKIYLLPEALAQAKATIASHL